MLEHVSDETYETFVRDNSFNVSYKTDIKQHM